MTEIDITSFDIAGVESIGVPKGDDREPCIAAFEEATGIEVPRPTDRQLWAVSQGIEFLFAKGKDIPGFANEGVVDLGIAGTDSVDMYGSRPGLRSWVIGDPMCKLVLMSEEEKRAELTQRLEAQRWNRMMPVATPLPAIVDAFAASHDLPIRSVDLPPGMTVSGSFEIMPRLLRRWGVDLVADRVASGETAQDNGLVELMPVMNIYPALVQRAA